jgi:Glycosyl transferase family 11
LGNEVVFDRSPLDNDETRAYTLDHWNCEVPFGPRRGRVIQEPDLLYHPELLKNYTEDVTLDGYWQSSFYWTPEVQKKIRVALTLRQTPSSKTLAIAREIENSNSCFLHVRRTDNLSVRGLAFHGLGSEAYWSRAVGEVCRLAGPVEIFVFSDDIEWCKKNPYFEGLRFVDHNSTGVEVDSEFALHKTDNGTEHEDLFLLSKCKSAIIGTSTFSYWGAWLGAHSNGGVVIRPKNWFVGEKNAESRDMFPGGWVSI